MSRLSQYHAVPPCNLVPRLSPARVRKPGANFSETEGEPPN